MENGLYRLPGYPFGALTPRVTALLWALAAAACIAAAFALRARPAPERGWRAAHTAAAVFAVCMLALTLYSWALPELLPRNAVRSVDLSTGEGLPMSDFVVWCVHCGAYPDEFTRAVWYETAPRYGFWSS